MFSVLRYILYNTADREAHRTSDIDRCIVGGDGQSIVRGANDNAFVTRLTFNPFGDMPYSEADLDQSKKLLLSVGANYFYDELQATRTGAATTLETNNLNFAQPRNRVTLVSGVWLNRGLKSLHPKRKARHQHRTILLHCLATTGYLYPRQN